MNPASFDLLGFSGTHGVEDTARPRFLAFSGLAIGTFLLPRILLFAAAPVFLPRPPCTPIGVHFGMLLFGLA